MAYPALPPAFLLTLGLLALPGVARAELGGSIASVQVDRGRIAARMTSRALGGYQRHEMTRANGGSVHARTNAQGGKPDLRTLLGPYFTSLQADGTGGGRTMHALRRPPQVNRPDLQIQTAGHMGWVRGVALIPSLAPAGFDAGTLAIQP